MPIGAADMASRRTLRAFSVLYLVPDLAENVARSAAGRACKCQVGRVGLVDALFGVVCDGRGACGGVERYGGPHNWRALHRNSV
eukprot:3547933-Amphidinium_carterae.1